MPVLWLKAEAWRARACPAPARSGILFHGVPGTGKTLVARALAGACAKHSPTPVTFFARKGADCLGKFHGEAERTLRLLFEEVRRAVRAVVVLRSRCGRAVLGDRCRRRHRVGAT